MKKDPRFPTLLDLSPHKQHWKTLALALPNGGRNLHSLGCSTQMREKEDG
ncbi:unnamed protein product, partial [Musa hybrid cultivar]